MDEVFVDVTTQCRAKREGCNTKGGIPEWCGFVHTSNECVAPETRYRVMDIRVPAGQIPAGAGYLEGVSVSAADALLRLGSVVAQEARDAVKKEVGFR